AHPDGELASARAAGAAGTLMVLSAQSSRTLEEVAQTATGPLWFQQYFFKERSLTLDMARRAEEAGYAALCLTLDAKVKPKRERNMRNNYAGPASPNYAHLDVAGSTWSFGLDGPTGANDLRDPASTWEDLDWLAAHTRLPLVVKGIVVGETGVRMVLEMLRDELDATMGMCGRTTVASVDRECLVGVSPLLALFPHAAPFLGCQEGPR